MLDLDKLWKFRLHLSAIHVRGYTGLMSFRQDCWVVIDSRVNWRQQDYPDVSCRDVSARNSRFDELSLTHSQGTQGSGFLESV